MIRIFVAPFRLSTDHDALVRTCPYPNLESQSLQHQRQAVDASATAEELGSCYGRGSAPHHGYYVSRAVMPEHPRMYPPNTIQICAFMSRPAPTPQSY